MTKSARSTAGRPWLSAVAALVLALAGSVSLTALAGPPHGGDFGGPMMMDGPGPMLHMLDLVGATADQRSQIQAIMKAAHADLRAQRASAHGLHQQMMQVLTQASVDDHAAEALRQQMQAQHDQSSRRMMQAMIDASRVLSADQRQLLGQKLAQRSALMERQRAEMKALEDGTPQ